MSLNTVVHIPHASTTIPDGVRAQFAVADAELQRELNLMTDWYTDILFGGLAGCTDVVFPVSRLVLDPERFEDDAQEPMAAIGMGVVYRVTSGLKPLRRQLTDPERAELLDTWYRPHHAALEQAVRGVLEHQGHCLVLDAHSFPSQSLPYEAPSSERPEICLGSDEYHTPVGLLDFARVCFESAGFTVAVNTPFAGALVPSAFYRSDPRVSALMIEVRRDLYLDESTVTRLPTFDAFRDRLRQLVTAILNHQHNR